MPVENIGRYQIIGELGKGAMGVVYKATDPNIGRTVALKTLRLDLEGMEAEELLRRFKNEARAAGVLNHPNIVTIYDAGEHSGMFYIAMEFIEGATLQQLLKQERVLPVERIIDIVRQVCAGLDFAHSKGIIHRDVKPANIMLEPNRTAKIMDFGIAKSGGSGMTSTGQVVGTPNYMSPEQVKGQPLDGRSDLFSLGVVMYEMLTGERPFMGQNVTTIIYKIVNESPAAPHALDTTMHPGLSAVAMKALAKAPDARYQDGASLAKDLANYKAFVPPPPQDDADATARAPTPPSSSAPMATAAAKAAPVPTAAPKAAPAMPVVASASPRPAAKAAAARKTPVPGIVIAVVALVLAAGGYFGVRSMRSRTAPSTVQTTPDERPPVTAATSAPQPARPSSEASTAVPQTGEVRVSSSPPGAQVTIDGRSDPRWVTPFTAAKLEPGAHTLAFAKDGYQTETRQVEVAAGKRAAARAELQALKTPTAKDSSASSTEVPQERGVNPFRKLRRLFGGNPQERGTLEMRTRPRGAAITINDTLTQLRTPAKLPLPPGKYRITLSLAGFKPIVRTVEVEKGKSYGIEEILEKQ